MTNNILFITAGLGYGGAEKMLCFAANVLSRSGHKVFIANLEDANLNTGIQQTIDSKIKVFTLQTTGKKVIKRFEQLRQIINIAKTEKADTIIGFTLFPNIFAVIAAGHLGKKSIVSERGCPGREFNGGLIDKVLLKIINSADGAVFQTREAGEFYSDRLQRSACIIPNPIIVKEDAEYIPFSDRRKSVVSVGRIDNTQKRYDIMINAFGLFSEKYPDYVLDIYGSGPYENELKSIVRERDLEGKVVFHGVTANSQKAIADSEIYIITSDYEGIANSLLEAMSMGLACVSTDHEPGGARMLIQNGQNGLLVPTGNTELLAEALSMFASDKKLEEKCAKNAREVLSRFAPDKIVELWNNYINDVINK